MRATAMRQMIEARAKKELDRLLSALRLEIESGGSRPEELESRLRWQRGRLARILEHGEELLVVELNALLKVLGVQPRDFYANAFRSDLPSPDRPAVPGTTTRRHA